MAFIGYLMSWINEMENIDLLSFKIRHTFQMHLSVILKLFPRILFAELKSLSNLVLIYSSDTQSGQQIHCVTTVSQKA